VTPKRGPAWSATFCVVMWSYTPKLVSEQKVYFSKPRTERLTTPRGRHRHHYHQRYSPHMVEEGIVQSCSPSHVNCRFLARPQPRTAMQFPLLPLPPPSTERA
jgi:hypothetical protein